MQRCTAPCTTWWPRRAKRSRRARAAAAALILLTVPSGPVAGAQEDWRSAVSSLLERRARAVATSDREAFASTVAGAPERFVRRQLRTFDRLAALPLGTYELELDDDTYLDLAPALHRIPSADEVHVVAVTQRLGLGRWDPQPSAETLLLTVVRRDGRWSVVDDDPLDDLGLMTDRNVWDLARVQVVEHPDVLVLHQDESDVAADLAPAVADAIDRVEDSWPLQWPARTVLVIPPSTDDLERIFETTVDLSPFVAFAAHTSERTIEGIRGGGIRVYIQPDTYFRQPASYRTDVLGHEMTHVAGVATRGAFTPAWLEEGVAQLYGERSPRSTTRLQARIASGTFVGRLPREHEFFLGDGDDIALSYESSLSFVRYLRDRFDAEAPARLYAALGEISPVSFGTARYHLDRAARRAFGASFDRVHRAWLRSVGARIG